MKKKIFAFITAAALCLSMAVTSFAGTISETTSYSLKDEANAKKYTSEEEYKNLTITPRSEDKPITLSASSLYLSGGGSKTDLNVHFNVTGDCTVSVKFSGTSSDERTLVLEEGNGGKSGTAVNSSNSEANASVLTYSYTGSGDTLYIYSKSKGIYLYSLTVTYPNIKKGDANGDKKITDKDAKTVLKHISGISSQTLSTVLSAMDADGHSGIDLLDAIWILNNKTQENVIEPIDTSDGTEVNNFSSLKSALSKKNAKVYVTDDIDCTAQLSLTGNQSLIGVPKTDGTLPELDFSTMSGTDIINNSSGDGDVGISVRSSGNTLKNLVVSHAHDNGVLIKDSNAHNNTIENCILRYNNDSGLQITNGAYANTIKNVYSYRNCDVFTGGSNADGFAVKLGAGSAETTDTSTFADTKNTFENCFAWDNGDDGWDSYDKSSQSYWTYKIDYTNCMCWNNGIPAVHLGYTDYVKALPLDEELPVIQRIKARVSDSVYQDFKTAYNNGTIGGSRSISESAYYSALDGMLNVSIPALDESENKINFNISTYIMLRKNGGAWNGNPNGFKIGSAYTKSISERTLNKCIAFDHRASGFDKNNSKCNIELTDTISFSNYINYHLSGCTSRVWSNVMGWDVGLKDDLPTSGVTSTVTKPSDFAQKEALVREAAQEIIDNAADNKFTATDIFDTVF